MSVDCISWAFKLKIPPTEKFILLAIADRADKDQRSRFVAWPSYSDIVERTGYNDGTAKRAVKKMESWGLLTREKREHISGRTRSNNYILHIDRAAPEGLMNEGGAETPSENTDSENSINSTVSGIKNEGGLQSATLVENGGGDSSATHEGTRAPPPIMKRKIETSDSPYIPPNEAAAHEAQPRSQNEHEAMLDDFRKLVIKYQQAGLIRYFGPEDKALVTWKKMSVEHRAKALACLHLYLNGKKHQWRDWKNSDRADKPKTPPKPASLSDYLRTKLYETVGTPVNPVEENESAGIILCRKIAMRGSPDTRDFRWPYWHKVGSAEWNAWDLFFKANGYDGAPQRQAKTFEIDYMNEPGFKPAKYGEIGWRFETEWPPEPEYENQQQESVSA